MRGSLNGRPRWLKPAGDTCQRGEIGRHDGFKIHCLHGRGGSSPPAGTTFSISHEIEPLPILSLYSGEIRQEILSHKSTLSGNPR